MAKIVGEVAISIGADIKPLQGGLRTGATAIDDFGDKARIMGKRVDNASGKTKGLSGALSRFNGVSRQTRAQIQNTSFQLQDMAVQMQMGTRTSTILAQQLPQLAGGFGAVGAVVGVLAGVGIPALAYAFSDTFEKSESLNDVLKRLKETVDSYSAAASLATMTTDELRNKFGTASAGLQSTLDLLEMIARNEAQRVIDDAADAMIGLHRITAGMARGPASELTRELMSQRAAIRDSQGDISAQIDATRGLLDVVRRVAEAKGGISAKEEAIIKQVAETLVQMEMLRGKVAEVESETGNVVTAFMSAYDAIAANGPAIDSLIGKAGALASAAWNYAGAMGKAAALNDLDPFGGPGEFKYGTSSRFTPPRPGPVASGSGAASGRDFADEFERLKEKFATEAETIQLEYEKQLEMLAEFRSKKAATEAEFNDLERRIQREHVDKMADIERKGREAKIAAITGAFGDLSSLMRTENSKLFKIGKAAAIAAATIDGLQAATSAWQKGMDVGGPPAAALFAAGSLAKTNALISSIKSTSESGGGGVSGAAGGATVSAAPSQYVTVNLTGEGAIPRDSVRGLIDQINDAIEDGAQLRGIVAA